MATSAALTVGDQGLLWHEMLESGMTFQAILTFFRLIRRTEFGKVIVNKAGKTISFTIQEDIRVAEDARVLGVESSARLPENLRSLPK